MAFSNFQHGFKAGVTIRGIPIEVTHPGRVFWVGNNVTRLDNEKTAADGNDGTFLAPFSTIEGALNASAVVASRGDVVFVRPGHTLAVTSETTLALDKAGVAIIGLGSGADRPTLTHTAPSGTVLVTAANVTFKNFLHTIAGTDNLGLDAAFKVSAVDANFENLEFRDLAASSNFLQVIQLGGGANATANQADRARFTDLRFILASTLGGVTKSLPIVVEAVTEGIVVERCHMFSLSEGAEGLVRVGASYNVTNILMKDCLAVRMSSSAAAGTVGTFISGGGTGAAGSGGTGVIINCIGKAGSTQSNNRFAGINALTTGLITDCKINTGGLGTTATTNRDIISATLTQINQWS